MSITNHAGKFSGWWQLCRTLPWLSWRDWNLSVLGCRGMLAAPEKKGKYWKPSLYNSFNVVITEFHLYQLDYECELINFPIILRWDNNSIFWHGVCSVSKQQNSECNTRTISGHFWRNMVTIDPKISQQLNSTVQFWLREKRKLQLKERTRPCKSQGIWIFIGKEMQQHVT